MRRLVRAFAIASLIDGLLNRWLSERHPVPAVPDVIETKGNLKGIWFSEVRLRPAGRVGR